MVIFPFGEIKMVIDKNLLRPLAQRGFGNVGDILSVETFKVWIQMFVPYLIIFSHPILLVSCFKCS